MKAFEYSTEHTVGIVEDLFGETRESNLMSCPRSQYELEAELGLEVMNAKNSFSPFTSVS